jgi:hypothetical protein
MLGALGFAHGVRAISGTRATNLPFRLLISFPQRIETPLGLPVGFRRWRMNTTPGQLAGLLHQRGMPLELFAGFPTRTETTAGLPVEPRRQRMGTTTGLLTEFPPRIETTTGPLARLRQRVGMPLKLFAGFPPQIEATAGLPVRPRLQRMGTTPGLFVGVPRRRMNTTTGHLARLLPRMGMPLELFVDFPTRTETPGLPVRPQRQRIGTTTALFVRPRRRMETSLCLLRQQRAAAGPPIRLRSRRLAEVPRLRVKTAACPPIRDSHDTAPVQDVLDIARGLPVAVAHLGGFRRQRMGAGLLDSRWIRFRRQRGKAGTGAADARRAGLLPAAGSSSWVFFLCCHNTVPKSGSNQPDTIR